MNIPNALTIARIILVILVVFVYYIPYEFMHIITAALFGLASITDWLDGYLARRLKQTTPLGAFLDPVADKLMVTVVLVLLIEQHHVWWFTLPAIIIIAREIVISALREWMAELGQRTSVAVSWAGKIKTAFQMVAILLLLLAGDKYAQLHSLGLLLLYLSVILTVWSMFGYLKAAKEYFVIDNNN